MTICFPLEEVAKLGYNVFYHGQKGIMAWRC